LTENIKLELGALYNGPYVAGTMIIRDSWEANMALRVSCLKNKLDITTGVDDIFYTSRFAPRGYSQKWEGLERYDTRRFKISLTYKFGKIKVNERTVRSSNEEEKQRIKD
jgi:hypothetical protein